MSKRRSVTWTRTKIGITVGGVISALLILPNLGKGWGVVRWITDAFPTAYAAKETADQTQQDFHEYIMEQRAYTKALNQVIQQQQAPNRQVPTRCEYHDDRDGSWWCRDAGCDGDDDWYRCE